MVFGRGKFCAGLYVMLGGIGRGGIAFPSSLSRLIGSLCLGISDVSTLGEVYFEMLYLLAKHA